MVHVFYFLINRHMYSSLILSHGAISSFYHFVSKTRPRKILLSVGQVSVMTTCQKIKEFLRNKSDKSSLYDPHFHNFFQDRTLVSILNNA